MNNKTPKRLLHRMQYIKLENDYLLTNTYYYYSSRYDKSVTLKTGFRWDGATAAIDLEPEASGVHDWLCGNYLDHGPQPPVGEWDDGSSVSNWQASMVYRDILRATGHTAFRSSVRMLATFFFGGSKIKKKNGWFFT